jgi:anti-anti-sigma factor
MSDAVPAGQATHGQLDRFGVNVSYADDHAVLTVYGEIDMMTAPILGAIVNAVVAQGHGMVVVDASAIEFMDAAGLRVLVTAHNQLLTTGHRLVVRAPTDVLAKLLQISRVAELVWVEPALIGATPRSRERAVDGDGRPVSSFVRAHAIPAGLDVVDAALLLVAELARSTIGAADGVSVSLRRHGHITTVAASDETIVEMDRHQYETGQGPCLSAAGEGTPFHVPSVEDEQRWPAFTPEALAQGIKSILSNPLLAESGPVGALNMYSRTRGAFAAPDQLLAALFARHASEIASRAAVDVSTNQSAIRLQEALQTRALIAQAQGVLMGRNGVSAEEAYSLIRRFSREHAVSLRERARQIVAEVEVASDA